MSQLGKVFFVIFLFVCLVLAVFVLRPKQGVNLISDSPVEGYMQEFTKSEQPSLDFYSKHVLTYFLHGPDKPVAGDKYPLVLVLHGSTGKAYAAAALLAQRPQFPAYILVPALSEHELWAAPGLPPQDAPDQFRLAEAVRLIGELEKNNPIDPRRIYVIGCSEGGSGTYGAAEYYPDIFAAAVPISTTWSRMDAPKLGRVPLWIMHGAKDAAYPVADARSLAAAIRKVNNNAYYAEFPNLYHDCGSSLLYPTPTWQWLFSHVKN